jgi:hypothetical protein
MALGAQSRMSIPQPKPQPQQNAVASSNAPSYGRRPPMISDDVVQTFGNNRIAAAAGAGRQAMTEADRGGLSRGKGQQYAADIAQAGADVGARNEAVGAQMLASAANAGAQNDYENAMRNEQLGNAGLLENLRHQNSMAGTQRRGMQQSMYEAMRNGQFGLDQIRPNYSSILGSLLE